MKALQHFITQLITYVFYGVLIAVVVVWLPSDVRWMQLVALVTLAFLLVRFWQIKKNEILRLKENKS